MMYNKQNEVIKINESRFDDLLQSEKDLLKANKLIKRLRAENKVLKSENTDFVDFLKNMKTLFTDIRAKYIITMLVIKFKKSKTL